MQHDLVALDIDHVIDRNQNQVIAEITFESFNLTVREVDLYGKKQNAPLLQLPCKYNRHDLLTGREIYKQFRIIFFR